MDKEEYDKKYNPPSLNDVTFC